MVPYHRSRPVKLSDRPILDARLVAEVMEQSIAGQVNLSAARPALDCLESLDTPVGRKRVAADLAAGPLPHCTPHPDRPCLMIRTIEVGAQVTGHFVKRQFHPVEP